MKIRYKLVAQFTLIVAFILLIFSLLIYYRAEFKRKTNFYDRLQRRASTTARLLVDVKEFSPTLLKLIDKNSIARMNGEEIFVFNFKNELIYSNVDKTSAGINQSLINRIRLNKEIKYTKGNREYLGMMFYGKYDRFVVIASAIDENGKYDVDTLKDTLILVFLIGVLIVVIGGIFFAGQALRPIKSINQQIDLITAQNLKKRVNEGTNKDEIAELAQNFNKMLQRLELAFEQQHIFVSHASHELRTPLAAMKSEIQLGLEEKHTQKGYKEILKNLWEDTDRLIALSNGLLQLARSIDSMEGFVLVPLRIEELIFLAQQELLSSHHNYRVQANFQQLPSDENRVMVKGSETLLKNVFLNLLDNACKYSANHQAEVLIGFDEKYCIIKIIDDGIGIPTEAINIIFSPFYRAENTLETAGFGIGLSICKKILELHQGYITVQSQINSGSTFTVYLPHL